MDCRNFRKDLEDYHQGGLDFAGRFAVERHAEQCFVCGREKQEAERFGSLARDLHRVQAPPDFEAGLLERIHARDSSPSWFARVRMSCQYRWDDLTWRRLALGAAAASTLLAAGFGIAVVANRLARPDASSPDARSVQAARDRGTLVDSTARYGPVSPKVLYSTETGPRAEPAESDYVEYAVPGPGDRQFIMRLPKTIRMHYGQQSEEYFIRNVSH
ncbi:MAG: hypothetical protein DMG07_00290 [Acidobacteria bacterium]|nr:MAG: hypothetical protein DMG07_00290 [Acidobacteriota bacterium]